MHTVDPHTRCYSLNVRPMRSLLDITLTLQSLTVSKHWIRCALDAMRIISPKAG